MSSITYTPITDAQKAIATDVIAAHFALQTNTVGVFLPNLNFVGCNLTYEINSSTATFATSHPTYVFPTQSEFENMCAANAIENSIIREAGRVQSFQGLKANPHLALLLLVYLQLINPNIKDFNDAFTFLRPLEDSAAQNPINRAFLGLPSL